MRKTLFVITMLLTLLVASNALAAYSDDDYWEQLAAYSDDDYWEQLATSVKSHAYSADGNWEYIAEGDIVCISYYSGNDKDTITSITVPTTIDGKPVSGMSGNPFLYCSSLQNIIVAPDSPFVTIDSVLFDQSMQTLICYPRAKTGHDYSVPQGVETIGESAFSSCHNLNSITLPDSVTLISKWALSNCWNLRQVILPESLIIIDDWAFQDCGSLITITLPDSVLLFGDGVFQRCNNFIAFIVSPDSAFTVIDGVLFNKSATKLICYPVGKKEKDYAYIIPEGTQSISDYAFSNCSYLSTVTCPESLTTIDTGAFSCCINLNTITLPKSLTSIGQHAFYSCTNLKSISLPDSLTTIGNYAFQHCIRLSTITLPDSLTTIGYRSFHQCHRLTSIIIPESVTFIDDDAFLDCPNLTLTVTPNSYAEQYCKDNDLPYTY